MIAFTDDHRDAYGFEPIYKVLPIAPSTYREHVARRRDQIHRAPSRGGHRTLGRQRRRFLRQRARRDHRRPLQGRGHSSARAVVLVRGGRVRHARMGGMVQQQKAAGAGRKHSSGRSRSPLPCAIRCARQGSLTQNKLPPEKPGRFTSSSTFRVAIEVLRLGQGWLNEESKLAAQWGFTWIAGNCWPSASEASLCHVWR